MTKHRVSSMAVAIRLYRMHRGHRAPHVLYTEVTQTCRLARARQPSSISFARTATMTASILEWIWSFSRMFLT